MQNVLNGVSMPVGVMEKAFIRLIPVERNYQFVNLTDAMRHPAYNTVEILSLASALRGYGDGQRA